jgi:hypothetical protein
MSGPKSSLDDTPSVEPQPSLRDPFPELTELLRGRRHGPKVFGAGSATIIARFPGESFSCQGNADGCAEPDGLVVSRSRQSLAGTPFQGLSRSTVADDPQARLECRSTSIEKGSADSREMLTPVQCPRGLPPRRCPRSFGAAAVRTLTVATLLSMAACWEYDESEGTFTLTATGGLEIVTHGRVRASHSPLLSDSGPDYLIALDVDSASPPLPGFSAVIIVTEARPTDNVRFVDASGVRPSNEEKTADVLLGVPSGVSIEWDTDSATVDFKAVPGRHAVAGDFVLYVNCDHCGPPKKGAHAVLRGSFNTHD